MSNKNNKCLWPLIAVNCLAALVAVGVFYVSKKPKRKNISIEDLRKAYSGLSPEDINEKS